MSVTAAARLGFLAEDAGGQAPRGFQQEEEGGLQAVRN